MPAFVGQDVVVDNGRVDARVAERNGLAKISRRVLVDYFDFTLIKVSLAINGPVYRRIMTPFASLHLRVVMVSVRMLTP